MTIFQTQAKEIHDELKPYYDLFTSVGDFIEKSFSVLWGLSKLNVEAMNCSNQFLGSIYLKTLSNTGKILLLANSIGPSQKLIAFCYQRAYQSLKSDETPPLWSRYALS